MKRAFFQRSQPMDSQRGVTMVLVAIAMVAIIAMAALSIDVVTLYLARQETQRSTDAAALTAARVLSLSGITGDPLNSTSNWAAICGGSSSTATQAAQAVAQQNSVGGIAAPTTSITVTYSAGGGGTGTPTTNADCTQLSGLAFGVNPMVTVQVNRGNLPTFFSRIWGRTGNSISATATAEAFNPSNSGTVGNQVTGTIIPVQPRCVKPWAVPNLDPLNPNNNPTNCTNTCLPFVKTADGSIQNPGISTGGTGATGVIGERFQLIPNCYHHITGYCSMRTVPAIANHAALSPYISGPPNLEYLPGQVLNASAAVPSGLPGSDSDFEKAIAGCDQTTVYQCGVSAASANPQNMVDLSQYPDTDTVDGVMSLINEGDVTGTQPTGQDYFNVSANPYGNPSSFPFQIYAGSSNHLVTKAGLTGGTGVSTSPSVVSLPIYDTSNTIANNGSTSPITIVGFLQVFINGVDQYGNVDIVVLNVAGCSNGSGSTPVGTAVTGSSPVPVRLVTSP